MKWAALLLAMFGLGWVASLPARAQVQVGAEMARSNFLLYERVDLIITVQNVGGTDLVLDNNEGQPWLSFIVSKHNGLPVRPERDSTFAPLTLKAGETKTLRVNLTPLFQFRQEGQYTASAVIDLPGEGSIISQAVPFNVLTGRTVWTQSRDVDGSQRTYSLIRFSPDADTTRLYLRVEDPAENVVYANLALGDMISYVDPAVQFDPRGNIHVMQPIALNTYLYTRANADGKIVNQGVFRNYQDIPPRLCKLEDGSVVVLGGIAENPNQPRERLSDSNRPPATANQGLGASAPLDAPRLSGAVPADASIEGAQPQAPAAAPSDALPDASQLGASPPPGPSARASAAAPAATP